jgi:formylglycine-generating enzyme required for sulfatase activity
MRHLLLLVLFLGLLPTMTANLVTGSPEPATRNSERGTTSSAKRLTGPALSLHLYSCHPTPASLLPTPFTSVLYASYPGEFYDQQAEEWKAIATGPCGTDEAWWHYYKTAQYSNRFGSGEHDLAGITTAGEKVMDTEGFDLNYLRFVGDPDPVTRWEKLLKAHKADPGNSVAYTGLAAYYTIMGELGKRNETLAKLHGKRPIPIGVMEYNYNQLISVAENGILVTHGDADTYPSWLLQSEFDVRPDVTVVNLALLLHFEGYREAVKKELDLEVLFSKSPHNTAGLLEQLATGERPVFFAATGESYMPDLPADRLFVTGLSFQYSLTPVNNLRQIAKNFEGVWRLENLRQPLTNSPAQAVADQLNQNYLPALFELHEYYQENPAPQFREVTKLIQTVAARAGISEEVATYLRGGDPGPKLASAFPGVRAKDLYKALTFIPPGNYNSAQQDKTFYINAFFMQEVEVSNADYQLFLEDLLRQRRFDLIDSVAIGQIDFNEYFPEGSMEPFKGKVNAGHPAYDSYPVVNVNHRAAELYALWLTQAYNQDPKRKDGRKVVFRLPQEMEYAYAATGGKVAAPYPWGGPYYRNSKGCFLANFNTQAKVREKDLFTTDYNVPEALTEEQKANRTEALDNANNLQGCTDEQDGGFLTVTVRSYFPNDFGLYNMAGNAAEMLAEDDKSMGGSWLDPAYNMQIGVVTKRPLPHPSTGFRLVMTFVD